MTTRNELAELREAAKRPIFRAVFWIDTAERVITSAAGGALAVATAAPFALGEPASWQALATAAGVAALVSLLKAVAASATGTGSASLAPSV
ncbi:holin [Microbacterium phage Honk]|uniref:Holin n=1 Tax=Microbacterium phage Honk TaxID=2836095 RepID=A0A8F3E9Y4_9CAUD|nr:holin [Microbacterium phage Honk]